MIETPETRYADVGESQVAYQVFGDGPDLVLSIGFFLGHVDHLWELPAMERFLHRLSSFARVIMFDRRGTGASDPLPPSPGSSFWENWVDDLDAVLRCVGAERPSLLGSTDAGLMAIQFAATYPERVSSLILTNTGARVAPAPGDPYGIPTEVLEEVENLLAEEWGKEDSRFIDVFWPERATDPELRRWVARLQRSVMTPKRAVELWRMLRDIDVRSSLHLIQAPTLVVTGGDWRLVPAVNSEYLAEEIHESRLIILKGGGLVLLTHAEEYLDAVEEHLTGDVRPVESGRVLATLLFTDIVGSTQRAAELGDKRWKVLLDDHDRIVRRQLERFRGKEINTVGDGFVATFDGPGRAIQCACAIRDDVRTLGIEIRAGLHTGEIDMRGDDVAGVAVHTGARVSAFARAGEVLVSSTVKDLVAGSGIEFEDRGEQELKGVPGTWRLFAVRAWLGRKAQ